MEETKMDDVIQEVLNGMGWTDGFNIPIANEENRLLEAKIVEIARARAEADKKLKSLNERTAMMQKTLEKTTIQQAQVQSLISAHCNQLKTEKDLFMLAEHEESSLKKEMNKIDQRKRDTIKNNIKIQADVTNIAMKMEELKKNVEYNKEALLEWEEMLARGEEANTIIQKYSAEDMSNFQALDMKRMKLRMELEGLRAAAVERAAELKAMENGLDKTSTMYRDANLERQKLLGQWRESVAQLDSRDQAISKMLMDVELMAEQQRIKDEKLDEHQNFLDIQIANNKECNMMIEELNATTAKVREKQKLLGEEIARKQIEILSAKRMLASIATKLDHRRNDVKNLGIANEIKQDKIESLLEQKLDLEKRLDDVQNQSMSAAERATALEEMLDDEEKTLKRIESSMNKLQVSTYRQNQTLVDLKEKEALLEAEIKGTIGSLDQLQRQTKKKEEELQKVKVVVYGYDIQITRLESRIHKLGGSEVPTEDNLEKESKIYDLEAQLKEKIDTNSLLRTQIIKIEDGMRRVNKFMEADAGEMTQLSTSMQDRLLEIESGTRLLKNLKLKNQEKHAEENFVKLKVNQTEKELTNEGNKIYTLEKHRLEVGAAMKERFVEIQVQEDMLNAKKRTLNDEKSKLKMDISNRDVKIDQLQKKYDIIQSMIGKDEDGTTLSVTQIKIKSAQEKFELQQEGDELDKNVRRAEKEIRALENTLRVVTAANDKYKSSLGTVNDKDPEAIQLQQLMDEDRCLQESLAQLRIIMDEHNDTTAELTAALNQVHEAQKQLAESRKQNTEDLISLKKELAEQKQKLERADLQLTRALNEARSKFKYPCSFQVFEMDLLTREIKEQNNIALMHLSEVATVHVETSPMVTRYMHERGLTMPTQSQIRMAVRNSVSKSSSTIGKGSSMKSTSSGEFRPMLDDDITRASGEGHYVKKRTVTSHRSMSSTSSTQIDLTRTTIGEMSPSVVNIGLSGLPVSQGSLARSRGSSVSSGNLRGGAKDKMSDRRV